MNKVEIETKIKKLQKERRDLNNKIGNINKEIIDLEGAIRELVKAKGKITNDLENVISTVINRIDKNEKQYKFKNEYKKNVKSIIWGSGSKEALQDFEDGIKKAKNEINSLNTQKKQANTRIYNIDCEINYLKRTLNAIVEEENKNE